MGGHAAWRKRVAQGLPAKGSGGAICRHRPHLGRKGKDLILNRKGHIAGGNPKKMKRKNDEGDDNKDDSRRDKDVYRTRRRNILVAILVTLTLAYSVTMILFGWNGFRVLSSYSAKK